MESDEEEEEEEEEFDFRSNNSYRTVFLMD
jgi:hypothetical protein